MYDSKKRYIDKEFNVSEEKTESTVGSVVVEIYKNKLNFYNLYISNDNLRNQGYASSLLTASVNEMKNLYPKFEFIIEAQPWDRNLMKTMARSYFKIFKKVATQIKIIPDRYNDGDLRLFAIKGSF